MENSKNIFELSVESVQETAKEKIGRELTDDELMTVKKGIEWGLLTDLNVVLSTAINEAVERSSY